MGPVWLDEDKKLIRGNLLVKSGAVRNADRKKHPSKNTPLYPPFSGGQVSTPQNRTYLAWGELDFHTS